MENPDIKNTKLKLKQLNLPEYSFKIKSSGEHDYIFDSVRRKFVKLTPEEWVRQNFTRYLVNEGKYPSGLIGIEVLSKWNKMRRRVDILVHNRSGLPVMLVECKAPEVDLDAAFDQIVCYNMGFGVKNIVVTNGMSHFACRLTEAEPGYEYLNYIPLYEDLLKE